MPQLAPTPNSFGVPSPLKSRRPSPRSLLFGSAHDIPDDPPSPLPDNFPLYIDIRSTQEEIRIYQKYYEKAEAMGFFETGFRGRKVKPKPQNPYADQPVQDEYTSQAPPRYDRGNNVERPEKSPAWTTQDQRYGNGGSFGQNRAYGSSRFDGSAEPSPARQGGYGGLGPADDRSALFGAAPDRYRQHQPPTRSNVSDQSGSYGGYGQDGGYGNGARYDDRELTAEEQENQDIDAMKGEMKNYRRQDAASSSNALRLALQAEETGRSTLARLGAQREQLYNTERNLDLASSQSKVALHNSKKLETAAHMLHAPTFGSSKSEAARQEQVIATAAAEKEEREAIRKEAREANQRLDAFNKNSRSANGSQYPRSTLADRGKYLFDGDSEDDQLEDQIENNLGELTDAAKRLRMLAEATGREVDDSNKHIERIDGKAGHVDGQVLRNKLQLERVSARN